MNILIMILFSKKNYNSNEYDLGLSDDELSEVDILTIGELKTVNLKKSEISDSESENLYLRNQL